MRQQPVSHVVSKYSWPPRRMSERNTGVPAGVSNMFFAAFLYSYFSQPKEGCSRLFWGFGLFEMAVASGFVLSLLDYWGAVTTSTNTPYIQEAHTYLDRLLPLHPQRGPQLVVASGLGLFNLFPRDVLHHGLYQRFLASQAFDLMSAAQINARYHSIHTTRSKAPKQAINR